MWLSAVFLARLGHVRTFCSGHEIGDPINELEWKRSAFGGIFWSRGDF